MNESEQAVVRDHRCQVCDSPSLSVIPEFAALPRLTSDCRPFRAGGDLSVCLSCGGVQKLQTAAWRAEIAEIYRDYHAYEIAEGDEQMVLDPVSGTPRRRSDVILDRLGGTGQLPFLGSILDVGCGGGVTLRSAGGRFPGARLYGHELDAGSRTRLQDIPGFVELFSGPLTDIRGAYDLVTMIHSLEHFPGPFQALVDLRARVRPCSGRLFVEVCNVDENPFDLVVADHLLHFSPATLTRLARRAGYRPLGVHTDWVRKEISFLAGMDGDAPVDPPPVAPESVLARVRSSIGWLQSLVARAGAAAAQPGLFGIFGTSIAATWLHSQLADRVDFFVDEDPSREGRTYLDRPVYRPDRVPADAGVFVALAPSLAEAILPRLARHRFQTYSVV